MEYSHSRPNSSRLLLNSSRLSATMAVLMLINTSVVARSAAEGHQPNVLFIAIDDLNDWIGCMGGHPQALTPNMDQLAARGVLFTNAHCAAPACTPSRTSLFTGQRPQHTGVWANGDSKLDKIRPDAFLLTHSFEKAGYATRGTGKLGPNTKGFMSFYATQQRWSPLTKQAVEYSEDELPTKSTNRPYHRVVHKGQQIVLPLNRMPSDRRPHESSGESFDWGPFRVDDEDFGDTRITNWAIEALEQGSDAPLFLAVGYYRPHQPLWAPSRFFDRFHQSPGELPPVLKDDLQDLSNAGRSWALTPVTSGLHSTVVRHNQWQAAVEAYLACVSYVDHEIGRLLTALDNSSIADDTLIVLWSDHGWQLGEKQHWGKWTGWERSTKVPLIIVPPRQNSSQFAVGQSCSAPVNLIDLFPTLLELCHSSVPPHDLDGTSLVPLMKNPDTGSDRTSITMFNPGNSSLRSHRWRYIRYTDSSEELYDMLEDPHEWYNLCEHAEYKSVLERHREILHTYLDDK